MLVALLASATSSTQLVATTTPTTSSTRRELIKVAGTPAVSSDSNDLDPDDFLWEKLPGRCCFYGGPDPLNPVKWLGAHTCDQCTVWDLPSNFCHTSASACSECGMTLYCAPTPPLIAGGVVCTGASRVGRGCEDTLGTGVCASHSLTECQNHCRNNPKVTSARFILLFIRSAHTPFSLSLVYTQCEMLVFYPQERQGTCVLCADLAVRVLFSLFARARMHTPIALLTLLSLLSLPQNYFTSSLETTRVYGTTPAPPPPAAPRAAEHHYSLLSGPSPPPPPHPPPSPPAKPPRPLSHLGRHHTKQHFECHYQPQTEYSVDQSTGYTDRKSDSKEECCNLCGIKPGCQDFVFEPASGTCVLLPHVDNKKIISSHNEYTVAGSLQITVVKQAAEAHGSCEFATSSGYSGGQLGEADPLPGGEPIASKQDCCDACEREPRCAKFTYEAYSHACTLFAGYAEQYRTDGLISGILSARAAGLGISEGLQEEGGGGLVATEPQGGGGGGGEQHEGGYDRSWMDTPPPPVPPMLVFGAMSPPPSPPPGELEATKIIVADMSMGIASLMGLGFCICACECPEPNPSITRAAAARTHAPADRHTTHHIPPFTQTASFERM